MTGKESFNTPLPGFPNGFGFAPPELMRLLDHPCQPLWSILWVWDCWIWYIGYPGCRHLGSPYWGHQTGGWGLHHHRCQWSCHRGRVDVLGHPWKLLAALRFSPKFQKKISTSRHVIRVYNSKSQGLWDPLMLLTLNTCDSLGCF